jgi:spore germination cell wall hydrolase CwlJ-like protein
VLRRSIDVETQPFAKTFSRKAKRACAVFAVVAVTLSAFDLMNVSLINAATRFLRESQQRAAKQPLQIQSDINRVPQLLASPSNGVATATQHLGVARDAQPAAHLSAVQLASINRNKLPAPGMKPTPLLPAPQSSETNQPRAASGVRLPSPAERLHLTPTLLAKAQRCLANAIYFEARDEPVRGQIAVAQVVMNRVFSGFYPKDVCDVIYQNASRHLDCQFTFACDGRSKTIRERDAWARASRIAARVLAGDDYDPAVGAATHYHALYVNPDWTQEMKKKTRYGLHNFYRPVAWGSGADEPVWGTATPAQGKSIEK